MSVFSTGARQGRVRKNAQRGGSRSRFYVPLSLVSSRDVGSRASWASSVDSRLAAADASTRLGALRAANRDAFNDAMTAVYDVYRESARQARQNRRLDLVDLCAPEATSLYSQMEGNRL